MVNHNGKKPVLWRHRAYSALAPLPRRKARSSALCGQHSTAPQLPERRHCSAAHRASTREAWISDSQRSTPLQRRLADERQLTARELARASDDALELLSSWCDAGWAHVWTGSH